METASESEPVTIRGIAFDLEGTIVDVEELHHVAHLEAAALYGVNLTWEEAFERLPHFIGGPDEEVASEIASLAEKDISAEDVLKAKRSAFEKNLKVKTDLQPREGFRDFLAWVLAYPVGITIGTVTRQRLANTLLLRSGLCVDFSSERIVTREDVSRPKPHPDVYLETAKRMGLPASMQLVFEDSVVGVKAAIAAGSRVVALPTVNRASFHQSLRNAGAEAVFDSWDNPALRQWMRSIFIQT